MSLKYTVTVPEDRGSSFDVRVRVDLVPADPKVPNSGVTQAQAMAFLKSVDFRRSFQNQWLAKNFPGFGSDLSGRPEAIFRTYDQKGQPDRNSGVEAYEFSARLTQPL